MSHDASYKLLFSHAEMVADLLRGFVPEAWVKELDFSTLEKVGGSYVSDDLREREDDIIWRVRFGQEWLYVYLLLEFQWTVDRYMAVRILTYVGLLYQDLIRTGQLTPRGELPPILPVVLYNGLKRWEAPEEVEDLIVAVPGGLEDWSVIGRGSAIYYWMKGGLPRPHLPPYATLRRRCFGWRIAGLRRR